MRKKWIVLFLTFSLFGGTAFIARSPIPILAFIAISPLFVLGKNFFKDILTVEGVIGVAVFVAFGITAFMHPKYSAVDYAKFYLNQFLFLPLLAYPVVVVNNLGNRT